MVGRGYWLVGESGFSVSKVSLRGSNNYEPVSANEQEARRHRPGRKRLGNLRKVTNPLGHVTEMWYDALGRKTSMRGHYQLEPI
jgi:YD repeat-containing protein